MSGHWRPISLCAVLQKVFLHIVVQLLDQYSLPVSSCHFGFREGRQTLEIVDACRNAISKAVAWGVDGYMLRADVKRAFDHMRHSVIDEALRSSNTPPAIRHAIQLELAEHTMDLHYQGLVWEGVKFSCGGRQGGCDTPALWVRVFDLALKLAWKRWEAEKLGVWFDTDFSQSGSGACCSFPSSVGGAASGSDDGFWLRCMVWADDIVMFGATLAKTQRMFSILTEELARISLDWKPSSLEIMRLNEK